MSEIGSQSGPADPFPTGKKAASRAHVWDAANFLGAGFPPKSIQTTYDGQRVASLVALWMSGAKRLLAREFSMNSLATPL